MKKFQRQIENFICEHCGQYIEGNGYTNHCPFCLYSKHVDINPGDRAANCQGLMKPVWLEKKKNEYVITHECLICGYKKKNKVDKEDDFEAILKINKI